MSWKIRLEKEVRNCHGCPLKRSRNVHDLHCWVDGVAGKYPIENFEQWKDPSDIRPCPLKVKEDKDVL